PHLACRTSPAAPRQPHLVIHTSPATPRHPHLVIHTSPDTPRLTHLACHTSPATPRQPHLACRTSPAAPRLTHLACRTSPDTLRLPHPASPGGGGRRLSKHQPGSTRVTLHAPCTGDYKGPSLTPSPWLARQSTQRPRVSCRAVRSGAGDIVDPEARGRSPDPRRLGAQCAPARRAQGGGATGGEGSYFGAGGQTRRGLAEPGGAWLDLVGPGGTWSDPAGTWRNLEGPGGTWRSLVGPGGTWWDSAGPDTGMILQLGIDSDESYSSSSISIENVKMSPKA
ncbi:unnamed protein product, partial [Lampetra planeri]